MLAAAPDLGLARGLRRRQLLAVVGIEVRRNLLGRRALLVWVLALFPVLVPAGLVLFPPPSWRVENLGWAVEVYSVLFQFLLVVVFFGCLWVFTNLFRGEILDRSLHYYLLAPLDRRLLVAGKYAAGVLATSVLFGLTTAASFLLLYLPFGWARASEHLTAGPGFGHLLAYLGIAALACTGYGAVFLTAGILFRNPILPGAAIFVWEGINFLLPPLLKNFSVIHPLKNLLPVPVSEGPLALVAAPAPTWVSVGGLLTFAAVLLALSARLLTRLEVRYTQD